MLLKLDLRAAWSLLTLLRNPLRTLAALTDNERGILICFSNITAGGDRNRAGGGWGGGCENDTSIWTNVEHDLLHTPAVIHPSVYQLQGYTGMVSKQVWHAFIGVSVFFFLFFFYIYPTAVCRSVVGNLGRGSLLCSDQGCQSSPRCRKVTGPPSFQTSALLGPTSPHWTLKRQARAHARAQTHANTDTLITNFWAEVSEQSRKEPHSRRWACCVSLITPEHVKLHTPMTWCIRNASKCN